MRRLASFIFAAALLLPGLALAQDMSVVSEIRGGVLAHDLGPFSVGREDGSVDVNGEVLFASPSFAASIGAPRPHLGASINTQGDTSQIYGGATWEWDIAPQVFAGFSLGASIHNGELDTAKRDRASLGSRVLFRESVTLGYRFDDHNSVSLMFDHISNAWLADENEGLDTFGLRYGYRF